HGGHRVRGRVAGVADAQVHRDRPGRVRGRRQRAGGHVRRHPHRPGRAGHGHVLGRAVGRGRGAHRGHPGPPLARGGRPPAADPLLLPAYAGAFLSTVILSRGRFHIWGAVAGSIALIYITSGLVVGGVPYTWTQVINGVVLIVTVSLSTFLHRRQSRR